MVLRFSTQAFTDRDQKCTLVTFAPFRMLICTADEIFDHIIQGELKAPYVLEGESGDAAIGGIIKPESRQRDILFDHTTHIIENNREKGLRTGIIPALSIKARPERGALLLLVAHQPESEHVIEQESYDDYKKILQEFFDGKPGFYY